jgi:hypothetical protein
VSAVLLSYALDLASSFAYQIMSQELPFIESLLNKIVFFEDVSKKDKV